MIRTVVPLANVAIRAAFVFVIAALPIWAIGCNSKSSKSKTEQQSAAKTPPAKSAFLYRNAKKEVTAAEFSKTELKPETINRLSEHPALRELTFYECKGFNDSVFTKLLTLPGIHTIHCARSEIGDEGLKRFCEMPNLRHLTISSCKISSEGVSSLRSSKSLVSLTLDGAIDVTALKGLSALKQLQTLEITVAGFRPEHLSPHPLPAITKIRLPDIVLTDDDIASFPIWKTLEEIVFRASSVTDDSATTLTRFTNLKRLNLTDSKISNTGVETLAGLTLLEELSLGNCQMVNNDGLKPLAKMTNLKRLLLENSGVTGAGLQHLVSSMSLRYIEIGETQTSKEDVSKAAAKMPKCQINRIQQRPGPGE